MRDIRDITYNIGETVYRLHRPWEMKKSELTTKQKREARALIWGISGQKKCWLCGLPLDPRQLHVSYTIHHLLDLGQEGCNIIPRLSLAHLSCNSRRNKPSKAIKTQDKDRIPVSATEQLRQTVDYSQGSTEQQANNEAEVPWRNWMWEQLQYGDNRKGIEKFEAINGGAEKVGVSPQAVRDYLNKAKSKVGPFEEVKENGKKWIRVRKGRLES